MTSDHGEKRTVYNGKRARSARLRRLRETKPYATKDSECDGLFAIPKWRMDEPMKDAKLQGAVGDMSSGINLKSLNPIECPDHFSSDLAQIKGKGKIGNEEASEKLVGTLKSGSVSLIGRRRTMEDAVTEAPGVAAGKYSFFAAYDGHGGDMVANACSERLHKLLENELKGANSENPSAGVEAATGTGNVDWKKVIAACFSRMDDEVAKEEAVGSTAVVVIVGKEEVVVANCGDSRAVLCRCGVAIPLSFDHKPERTDERERVEAAGGRIIDWDGCRVQGVLSTSRSIGDHYLKPYVMSEPEVTLTQRTESDEFLIIATDGLWDVVSNEFACEVVRRCLRRKSSTDLGATEAAAILAELAVAKGSRDNISVIVVQLKTKF